MYAIVCMDINGVIGINGDLACRFSEDMKHFKEITSRGEFPTLIMGRNTYNSIGKPLEGRHTVVLTSNPEEIKSDSLVQPALCPDLKKLGEYLSGYENLDDVAVCGGAAVYRELLKYCDTVYITLVLTPLDADPSKNIITRFPDTNFGIMGKKPGKWELSKLEGPFISNGIPYMFLEMKRPKDFSFYQKINKDLFKGTKHPFIEGLSASVKHRDMMFTVSRVF